MKPSSSLTILLAIFPLPALGHGYLKTPRSRNLYAYLERDWEDHGGNSPFPEDCPHCLNRGGTRSQCGLLEGIDQNLNPWVRNYAAPLNNRGDRMPPTIQETYTEGATITVEVQVTTHHKGHFVISACPIVPLLDDPHYQSDEWLPLKIPTEECFAQHRLKFVRDKLYGAPPDPDYPDRAYIAPALIPEWSVGEGPLGSTGVVGAPYEMEFELPMGLVGEVVLIQWYYLTANSCKHEGYESYPFPESWGSDVNNYAQMEDCGPVPEDGAGVPEQFWNCAEVKIVRKRSGPNDDNASQGPSFEESWYKNLEDVEGLPVDPIGDVVAGDGDIPEAVSEDLMAQAELIAQGEYEAEESSTEEEQLLEEPAPAPSGPCADPSFTGYESTTDCTGYILCQSGHVSSEYPCGDGTLYSTKLQMCTWADEVNCHGANLSPGETLPPFPPTKFPTQKPNALLEWDRSKMERPHDKTIIGYYASWQWYDRDGLAAPANMDFSKITRANFAFFQITEEGYIYGTDSWADPITLFGFYDWMQEKGTGHQYCSWDAPGEEPVCNHHYYEDGLIYRAHAAGAEVYPSIGGWSLSDPFPTMAANADYRRNFVSQCIQLIKAYNFDGIDIDWEYPGYEPHSGTEKDGESWNLLLDDLRAALDELEEETGRYYGITAALPCGPSIIDNQDIAHVGQMLTELNLMTYDFHGTWNEKVGVNAPLYDQEDSPEMSVHGCMENWVKGGAPKEKINIGFPFYGRSFLGAKGLYEEFDGAADESMWHEDEGCPQYYNIIKKFKGLTSFRDEQTMTQVAYSKSGALSYDDPRAICDKTEYAMDHGLNGYIIWELSGDILDDLSTPLLDAANAKLEDPGLNCSTMSDALALVSKKKDDDEDAEPQLYYPLYDGSNSCANDGNQPAHYKQKDMFDTEKECCDEHFSWSDDCVSEEAALTDSEPGKDENKPELSLYYPKFDGSNECSRDGKQPSYVLESDMFNNGTACCEKHFGWTFDSCVSKVALFETVSSSTTPSDVTTTAEAVYESQDKNPGFSHVVDYSSLNIHAKHTDPTSTLPATDLPSTTTIGATTTSETSSSSTNSVTTTDAATTTSSSKASTELAYIETTSTTTATASTTTAAATTASTTTTTAAATTTTTTSTITTSTSLSTTTEPSTTTTSISSSTTTITEPSVNAMSESASHSGTVDHGQSSAAGFASSSQQFVAHIHDKEPDKKPSQSLASSISSAINDSINDSFNNGSKVQGKEEKPEPQSNQVENNKPRPQNIQPEKDKIKPQSNQAEFRLHVDDFSAELLPFKSGHSLDVSNPHEMARRVKEYLMAYFKSLSWQYTKHLTNLELQCGRSKEKNSSSEVKLVMTCNGDGVFDELPIPPKREFEDLIDSGFSGENHGQFLEFMYSTYSHDVNREPEVKITPEPSKKEKKENKLQQSLLDRLDEVISSNKSKDSRDVNEVKQAKKDKIKLRKSNERNKDELPGKTRMLRSSI